jgi:NitT/TauT family transport system substrate-binding protein
VAVASIASVGAGVATGGNAEAASTGATETISAGVQQGYNLLPMLVAIRHGFFKKAGISDVKFNTFGSIPAMLAAVAQGQLDIGGQSIPPLVAYDRATSGTKLKVVLAGTQGSIMWFAGPNTQLPAATAKDWKSAVRAWKGKKIGVPAPNGLIQLLTNRLLKDVGLSPSDVSYQVVGVGPPAVAALQQGLVDVISGDPLTLALLKPQKLGYTVLSFPDGQGPADLVDTPTGVWFASDSTVSQDPARFTALVNGWVRARAFIADPKNKKDILDLLTRKVGLSAAEAQAVYPLSVATYGKAKITRQIFDSMMASYIDAGIVPAPQPTYDDSVFNFAK